MLNMLTVILRVPIIADMALPIIGNFIILFPVILLVEALVLWLYTKYQAIGLSFGKVFVIVFIANIVSSLPGMVIDESLFYKNFWTVAWITFLISVVIEWGIYIIMARGIEASKFHLFAASSLSNFASYFFLIQVFLFTKFGGF